MNFAVSNRGYDEDDGITVNEPRELVLSVVAVFILPTDVGKEPLFSAMQYKLPPAISPTTVLALTNVTDRVILVIAMFLTVMIETVGIIARTVGADVGELVGVITVAIVYALIVMVADVKLTSADDDECIRLRNVPLAIAVFN